MAYVGFVIFGLGLATEAIADWQKYRFNQRKTKDIWIDNGLWRISRHPNYLGEIMVWAGIYVFCFTGLSITARLVSLASPLYIASILLFFSGLPLVEKAADKRWGDNPDYQEYKRKVPVLVPNFKSLKRLK
jgi:steroid 5-alpha reductase family enzyme